MKKLFISIPIVLGLLSIAYLKSCSDDVETETVQENENVVVYEDSRIEGNEGNNPFENNIFRVELLGSNIESERIVSAIQNKMGSIDDYNILGIKKFYVNNSNILLYTIPSISTDNRIVVYKYEDMYQVNLAEYTPEENGITKFRMKTLDGALIYGMSINENNEIGEFVHSANQEMNQFSNRVHDSEKAKLGTTSSELKSVNGCCRQAADFAGCFNCTTQFFAKKWYGAVAFGLIGREFTTAIAISCIGAGPNTFC